jgi:hypothetical protein
VKVERGTRSISRSAAAEVMAGVRWLQLLPASWQTWVQSIAASGPSTQRTGDPVGARPTAAAAANISAARRFTARMLSSAPEHVQEALALFLFLFHFLCNFLTARALQGVAEVKHYPRAMRARAAPWAVWAASGKMRVAGRTSRHRRRRRRRRPAAGQALRLTVPR